MEEEKTRRRGKEVEKRNGRDEQMTGGMRHEMARKKIDAGGEGGAAEERSKKELIRKICAMRREEVNVGGVT